MIWRDPVWEHRPVELLLHEEMGFPADIVARVKELDPIPFKKKYLSGLLVKVVGKGSGLGSVAIALRSLVSHVDQAMYLQASQVLTLFRERLAHDGTGLPIGASLYETDVVIISGARYLPAHSCRQLDELLSVRCHGAPPRVTIILDSFDEHARAHQIREPASLPATEAGYSGRTQEMEAT